MQWDNFCRNLGVWRGSFATYDHNLQLKDERPSLLTLESIPDQSMATLTLRRWQPDHEMRQVISSIGRQDIFFSSGAFSKGPMQLAPAMVFAAEYAFVGADRRHRLVLLTDPAGQFTSTVLMRECRDGSAATHRPPLTAQQLLGPWNGVQETMSSGSNALIQEPCSLVLDQSQLEGLRFLPDAGGFCIPSQISYREGFAVEAWWLASPTRLERLVRRYDQGGAWRCSLHQQLERRGPNHPGDTLFHQ